MTMLVRFAAILLCCWLSPAIGAPEMLPKGSIYFINSTDREIVFTLFDNGRQQARTLSQGGNLLYRIQGPDSGDIQISVVTGEQQVRYQLVPDNRYVLYWNAGEGRYDVGSTLQEQP